MAVPALFLEYCLASRRQLAGVGSIGDCRETQQKETGDETPRWVGEAHVLMIVS